MNHDEEELNSGSDEENYYTFLNIPQNVSNRTSQLLISFVLLTFRIIFGVDVCKIMFACDPSRVLFLSGLRKFVTYLPVSTSKYHGMWKSIHISQ